jgi:hypothetical protein
MSAEPNDAGIFNVVAITCFPGQRFVETLRISFTSRRTAYEQCDRLQDNMDSDGDPSRAYVVGKDNVPIRAGRAAHLPANYYFSSERNRTDGTANRSLVEGQARSAGRSR